MKNHHNHSVRFVRFGHSPAHIHVYDTPTTVNQGHRHQVRGRTSTQQGAENQHVHYYEGATTFADGHVHNFSGWTGPPKYLPNGSHYHEFSGQTSFADGHIHYYSGMTSEAFQ
ncbi:UNVERIFIED_CONTAM: hypothetical protein ABID98_004718 [Brevibacillus sp. OAP136]